MLNSKLMRLLVLASVLASVAAFFMPTAEAQQSGQMTATFQANDQKVKPLQGTITLTGSYTAVFTNDAGKELAGIPVSLTVTKFPSWASAVVSPANDFLAVATPAPGATAGQSTVTKTFTVTVSATQDAPAFTPDTLTVTVTTKPGTGGTALTGAATTQITADYFGILDVQLPEGGIKIARPQETVQFPLKITNFGNANTKVSIDIGDHDANLIVQPPLQLTIGAKQTGSAVNTADTTLSIQTPYHNGYLNQVGSAQFKLTSAYALDPKVLGDKSNVLVVVTTKGFYVPGPELPLVIGLVGLAGVLLRRRK